ncbi:hypothetical protein FJZ22_01165 [Candidatus Pacearchaeota archaeon]|nr:hypothetical protein [Candidatus Pacearchaeota archaeon]
MKWVFICILLFSFVSAHTSFELAEVYSPERTIVMALPETIVGELDVKNVFLMRDAHIEVPWEYGVTVRGKARYIWGVTPRTPGNYSIMLRDALVIVNGTPRVQDVLFPFMIRGNSSLYSFTPGVIDLNQSTILTLTSRANTRLTLPLESEGKTELSLLPGTNKINLTTTGIGFKEHLILGEYDVPLLGKEEQTSRILPRFSISPGSLSFRGGIGSTTKWSVNITNEELKDQKLTFEWNASLVTVTPRSLTLQEMSELTVSLAQPLRTSFTTVIMIYSGNYSYPLTVSILLTQPLNETSRERNYSALFCGEVPGFLCSQDARCAEEPLPVGGLAPGQICCPIACTSPSEPSSLTPWLLFLGACVLAGGAYYYYKVKKTPDAFEERIKSAEKKIHP